MIVGRWGVGGRWHVPVTPASRPAANQYHFPVLEAGNYEVERLCDLSPLLHYSPDIKINCLILGKHMLQFKLSALVCSGIICIDLLASSPFCLLTSWIIREKETRGGKAGLAFEYFAAEMKSTWEGAEGTLETNRIFIFSHFPFRFRQVACFVQLYCLYLFPCFVLRTRGLISEMIYILQT